MTENSRKSVTLHDIARATGFSANTVSRALKNKPDISRATCEQIQKVALEMGYVRNEMAHTLRSGRSRSIGVIVGSMSNPFYGRLVDYIQDAAQARGYSLMIMCSREGDGLEEQAVESALRWCVDGLLLFPSWSSLKTVERLRPVGVPCVLVSRKLPGCEMDCVTVDDEIGAYLITKHLLEAGRRPAFISTYSVVYSSDQRKAGFFRACREAGLDEKDCPVALCEDREEVRRQLKTRHEQGINGIFAFCDMEAWNLAGVIDEMGLRSPQDFALVGFDDIQRTMNLPIPLCTIGHDARKLVDKAMDLLIRRIQGEQFPPQTVVFEPELVCRGSCGRA